MPQAATRSSFPRPVEYTRTCAVAASVTTPEAHPPLGFAPAAAGGARSATRTARRIRARDIAQDLMVTGAPGGTRAASQVTLPFESRTQPWETAVPIVPPRFAIPW